MKQNILVRTKNVNEALKSVSFLQSRPVKEIVGMGLIYGEPSTGKTRFGRICAIENGWIYQRVNETDTPKTFFTSLYQNLAYKMTGQKEAPIPRGSTHKMYSVCLDMLQSNPQVIIIDEINNAFRHRSVFNSIRDLVDQTFAIIILIGEADAYAALKGMNEHYFDRVNQFVKFGRLDLNDIRLVVDQKSDVEMDDEVVNNMMMQTNGKWRQLDKLIFLIEGYAKANNIEKVTLDDIKQKPKDNDE